ncbi:RNA polymerase sigma factor SigA [Oxobacter pfennigii]|uniref:RNA polymerase sigma factor SigA n=1 Tax=Oxobacter pfennigii TaxID=36849 RepID=A0A0P8W566_9CLOT|nr:sigma-70 family RNA polymerase sigma factor [Oxobacter pfennigii]KPU43029.1 RNA polymerase sigma factor SigA [Oxobacter pfennigii]
MTNEDLINEYRRGNRDALNTLIENNMGLVKMAANRYLFNGKYEFDDLVQEGCIGLMKAVDKFNPDLDNPASFSTYAVYWINSKLSRYTKKNNYDATSLSVPINDEEDGTLMDLIPDNSPGPEEIEEEKDFKRHLCRRVSDAIDKTLTLREREIVKMRYGLNGPCTTPEKIGEIFNCPKENIKHQENRSLRKLRSCSIILVLRKELHLDSSMRDIPRGDFNTEKSAIYEVSRYEKLTKNTSFKPIDNNPFDKWYANLHKQRASLSRELDKITGNNFLSSYNFYGSRLNYDKTIEKQVQIQKQINNIDKTIDAVKFFTDQLMIYDFDIWEIFKGRINCDKEQDKHWRKVCGKENYSDQVNRAIEYIRKGLEINDMQYDF